MINIHQLNSEPLKGFVEVLGGVYEHSPWVAEGAWQQIPFADLQKLTNTMREIVEDASNEQKLCLLRAHPDLAGKLALEDRLTEESKNEQASLGLNQLSPEDFAALSDLNQRYQDRFDFPFIVCARLVKDLPELLSLFRERIENSASSEQQTALQQVHAIAQLRLEDLIQPDKT